MSLLFYLIFIFSISLPLDVSPFQEFCFLSLTLPLPFSFCLFCASCLGREVSALNVRGGLGAGTDGFQAPSLCALSAGIVLGWEGSPQVGKVVCVPWGLTCCPESCGGAALCSCLQHLGTGDVCTCVCIRARVYTCVCMRAHIYACTVCMHTHAYVHTCVAVHTRASVHACMCRCIHAFTCAHVCTCICTSVHTRAHMYTHVHTCTHVYTRAPEPPHVCVCAQLCVHACVHMCMCGA